MLAAIALPRNRQGVEGFLDLGHVFVGERRRLAVLDDARLLSGAGDGDGALATHPADGHLRRGHALALGNLPHRLDELQVLIEVLGLEARQHAPDVVLRQVVELA
jgi:hypothetical protein